MFTYDPTLLATNKVYQIRLAIGQTYKYDLIVLQDEEIQYFLDTNHADISTASIKCIDAMISRAGGLVDKETGQVSESGSQLLDSLRKLRDDLLTSVSRNTPIFAQFTGFFEEDRKAVQDDTEIYHDGLTAITENPSTRLLNGPNGPGYPGADGSDS
jgi:hypothetical protein